MEAIQLITIIGLAITLIVAIVAIIIGSKAKTNASAEISSMESNLSGKISSLVPTTDVKFTWNEDLVDKTASGFSLAKLMNGQYAFSGNVTLKNTVKHSAAKGHVSYRIGTITKVSGGKWLQTMKSHVAGSAVITYSPKWTQTAALYINSSQSGDDSDELAVYIGVPEYHLQTHEHKVYLSRPTVGGIPYYDAATRAYLYNGSVIGNKYNRYGVPFNRHGQELHWADGEIVIDSGKGKYVAPTDPADAYPVVFMNNIPVTDSKGKETSVEFPQYFVRKIDDDTMLIKLLDPGFSVAFDVDKGGKEASGTVTIYDSKNAVWYSMTPKLSGTTFDYTFHVTQTGANDRKDYPIYKVNHAEGWPIYNIPFFYVNLSSKKYPLDEELGVGINTVYGITAPTYDNNISVGYRSGETWWNDYTNVDSWWKNSMKRDNILSYEYVVNFSYTGPLALQFTDTEYKKSQGYAVVAPNMWAASSVREKFYRGY